MGNGIVSTRTEIQVDQRNKSNPHLGALGSRLHDEAEDTVARAAHGKSAQKLVLEGLRLCIIGGENQR